MATNFVCPKDCPRMGNECICCVTQYLGLPALALNYAAGSQDPNAVIRDILEDVPEEEIPKFFEDLLSQEGLAPIQ